MAIHLEYIYAPSVKEYTKIHIIMEKEDELSSIKISQHIKWKERYVQIVESHEFMDILKHLVQEKKDLQERLDIMEEILHSYLPTVDNNKGETNNG